MTDPYGHAMRAKGYVAMARCTHYASIIDNSIL